jgi:histidinol-phosphatase
VGRFRRREFEVEKKPDGSPVTDVDRDVESALRELIARLSPRDSVVGEEFGGEAGSGRCWYLDPIDGTVAFCDGRDRWSTLVALAEGTTVLVGVVDIPVHGRRVWAGAGTGAFDGRGRGGAPLSVSSVRRLGQSTVCDDYRRSIERNTVGHPLLKLSGRGRAVHPHQGHSALVVASGQAEVALASSGGPWDYAPFVAIVREAGGRTSNLVGDDRFDTGTLLSTNGLVHEEALEVLRAGAPPVAG